MPIFGHGMQPQNDADWSAESQAVSNVTLSFNSDRPFITLLQLG